MDERSRDEGRGTGGTENGATFAPARIRARGGPPILAAALALAVGGLVIAGALERLGVSSSADTSFGVGGPSPASSGAGASGIGEDIPPRFGDDMAPVVASNTDTAIRLRARRHPETTYVHGDVYVAGVTWVFISIQDTSGRVAGWASVSVPGAAGPTNDDTPTLRFDVEVAVPPSYDDRSIWIQANAYDALGRIVESTRMEMLADGNPGAGAIVAPDGFSPRPPPAGVEPS